MAGRDILLGFMVLLAGVSPGALDPSVNYPGPVCGVKGSEVTLPCTFSPLKSVNVQRVVWCQNHAICQGVTPSVYDSDPDREPEIDPERYSERNNPRYRYLGDKEGNCSLQISDLQERDDATLRFRMEANDAKGHFAGPPGVRVTVRDGEPMQIRNSSEPDGAVSLLCTALCTFHQLEVTWSRDGHALPQSGPALRLSALTAKDSGNYTCALKNDPRTESLPYRLHVEATDGGVSTDGGRLLPIIVPVVCGVLLAVFLLLFFIIRRRRAAAGAEEEQPKEGSRQRPDDDHFLPPAEEVSYAAVQYRSRDVRPPVGSAVEDVSYASVQFSPKNQSRAAEEEPTIYSSVAGQR